MVILFVRTAVMGCIMLLALLPASAAAQEGPRTHILARDGQAHAAIVIADEPDVTHVIARVKSEDPVDPKGTVEAWAQALAFWLEKATGAEFSIVKESAAPEDKLWILLGTSDLSRKHGFDGSAPDLEAEEALIRGFSKGVAIYGERIQANKWGAVFRTVHGLWSLPKIFDDDVYCDRGVGHAVSIFLEDVVGCRFYYPYNEREMKGTDTDFLTWTHMPDAGALRVPVSVRIDEAPAYLYRDGVQPVPRVKTDLEFGVPPGYVYFRWGGSENMAVNHVYNAIPKDFPDRPELWAKGKDGNPMYDRRQATPKCFAEPAHIDIYMDQIRHMDKTGKKSYSTRKGGRIIASRHRVLVGPADAHWVDHDKRAQKWYQPEREPVGSQSDLYFNFIARLAQRVNAEWPGRIVSAMGQNNYAEAPSERVDLPDNVNVLACISKRSSLMNAQKAYEDYNNQFIDTWHQKLDGDRKRLALWDYIGRPTRWTSIPVWAPNVIQRWYQRNRNKMAGCFFNFDRGYPLAVPMNILWHRLLWNPDLDLKAFYREFCSTMFGPAGDDMYELIMLCVDRYETVQWAERPGLSAIHGGAAHEEIFPEHVVGDIKKRFFKAWDKAKAADNPACAKRMAILYNEDGSYGMHALFKTSKSFHLNNLYAVPEQFATTVFHGTFEQGRDVSRETAFEGKGSLQLKGNGERLRRDFTVTLEPNRKYTVSAAMKLVGEFSNRQANVLVMLLHRFGDEIHALARLHVHTPGDGKWHTDEVTFLTGEKVGRIVFFVRNNHSTGTVYLDDLKIVTRKPVTATRVGEGAVDLDGKLDEAAWETARTYTLLEGVNPLNLRPTRRWWSNEFRVLYSDEALYIGVKTSGEQSVRAAAAEANDIYDDDHVSVVLARDRSAMPDAKLPDVADMKVPFAEKVLAEAKGRLYLSVNPKGITDPAWLQAPTSREGPNQFSTEIRVPSGKLGIDPAEQDTVYIDVRRWVGPRPHLASPPERFVFAGNKDRMIEVTLEK